MDCWPADTGTAQTIGGRWTCQLFSQEALAEAARIHPTYVSLLERGKRKPTVEVANRIAQALGVKLSALIEEAERESGK